MVRAGFSAVMLAACAGMLLAAAGCRGAGAAVRQPGRSLTILSEPYTIDRKYKSMRGPASSRLISIIPDEPAELLWVTGYEAVVVAEDGEAPRSQEFMCHSNVEFDAGEHSRRLGSHQQTNARLFTLSQGQTRIRLPVGFGVPVYSDEPLQVTTQVLNHNAEGEPFRVRQKVTLEYVRDRDLLRPMRPLFGAVVAGLVYLGGDDLYFGEPNPDPAKHGPGCLPGEAATEIAKIGDSLGRRFSDHWIVKPGREINHTLATRHLRLKFDTTLHYIATHLHPFAESLELRDLTTGETVFRSEAKNFPDKIGLEKVDYLSSEAGIPVYKDHEYAVVSVYNNTSGEPQDSMAVFYLYLLDKAFNASGPATALKDGV